MYPLTLVSLFICLDGCVCLLYWCGVFAPCGLGAVDCLVFGFVI